MTQPNLTAHIHNLEAELGFRLFDRLQRPVALTPAGGSILGRVQELLAAAERLERDAQAARQRHANGRLTLGTVYLHAQVLTGLLTDFAHYQSGIDVLLREELADNLLPLLANDELDASILMVRPGAYPMPEKLRFLPLHAFESVFVAPPGHRLAGRSEVAIEEFAGERFVLATGMVSTALKRALTAANVSGYSVFETNGSDMILSLVAQGMGVGIAPEFRVDQLDMGLSTFRASGFDLRYELVLAWPAANSDSATLQAFIGFASDLDWRVALRRTDSAGLSK